jgi:hypothetical protein
MKIIDYGDPGAAVDGGIKLKTMAVSISFNSLFRCRGLK